MDIVEELRNASSADAPLDYEEHWFLEERAALEIEYLRNEMLRIAIVLEDDGDELGSGYALRRAIRHNV